MYNILLASEVKLNFLAKAICQENDIKDVRIGKEKIKYVLADVIVLYIEQPLESS